MERVKDYVFLTSVSLALNVAVKMIQLLRRGEHAPQHRAPALSSGPAPVRLLGDANPLEG
jgi:hypothetical protein